MFSYRVEKIKLWGFLKAFEMDYKNGIIPPPKYVGWDCTRACNLNCEHCGAKKEAYPKELSTGKIKEVIDRVSKAGSEYFQTTGGEPLLRKDLLEIFEYAKSRGMKTSLATNGFLISESNAPKIARIFDSVQISLDGPEEIHNKIRGTSTAFQKAAGAIKLLKKNNAGQVCVSSVITPSNYLFLEQLAEIVKDINADIWKIITIMPVGRAKDNRQLELSKDQFNNLMEFCKKNNKEYKILLSESLGHLGKYEKTSRTLPFFCPVGFLAMCVGVDGNVRGCPEQPDTEFFREGNVLTEDILSIWQNGFKKYRRHLLAQNSNCQNCSYKKDCQGGCWVMKTKDNNCAVRRYCL